MLSFILLLAVFAAGGYVLGTVSAQHDGHLWSSLSMFHRVCLCAYGLLLILVLINGMFLITVILAVVGLLAYWLGYRLTAGKDDDEEGSAGDGATADAVVKDDGTWPRIPVGVIMRHASMPTILDSDEAAIHAGNGDGGVEGTEDDHEEGK